MSCSNRRAGLGEIQDNRTQPLFSEQIPHTVSEIPRNYEVIDFIE